MPPSYFPLRWESIGDQWWYASPIDFAAANGLCDLVKELLHIDNNLLIKLTSLRRIRRLETVWDDDSQFDDVAKCRSRVARSLLLDSETKSGGNSLIRAGYGGWLLYTAAAAGDVGFVRELLERDPFVVFGQGEYGVTDILYAAARSKNCEVFNLILEGVFLGGGGGEEAAEEGIRESSSVFKWEMMNRGVHAAARGGNLEILKGILGNADCDGVLAYRDLEGSTILHSASGRGQVEVVKALVGSYNIISATDNQGHTALHVAAYKGHLSVVTFLIATSPSLVSAVNNSGDTFLHMAVAGFQSPGFRRVDKQIELIDQLVHSDVVNIHEIINLKNRDGKTALHLAVVDNVQSNLVELFMKVSTIDLNVRDNDGMTALDHLLKRETPRSPSSEILIKRLVSAGGISNSHNGLVMGNGDVSRTKAHSNICGSPGCSFRIPDAEIFLYTGIENPSFVNNNTAGVEYSGCLSEKSDLDSALYKKSRSVTGAARRFKFLLQRSKRKERKPVVLELTNDDSSQTSSANQKWDGICSRSHSPIPLRQKYSKSLSLLNNKRAFSAPSGFPSPYTKQTFTTGLMHYGVIKASPRLAVPLHSFSGPLTQTFMSSPTDNSGPSCPFGGSMTPPPTTEKQSPSLNKKLMNKYLCFGAQGLTVDDPITGTRSSSRLFKRTGLVA